MMSASPAHGAAAKTRSFTVWSQSGVVGSVTSCSFVVVIASVLLLLPVAMRSEESEILLGDEEMQNDDLIVSRTGAGCPPDDEDDCTYDVQAKNKDALIYPISVSTTRKPRPSSRTTPTPTRPPTTPDAAPSRPSCGTGNSEDDDEDCADASSGAESPDATIDGPLAGTGDHGNQQMSSTIDGPQPPVPPLPTPTSFQATSSAATPLPHASDAELPADNNGSPTDGQSLNSGGGGGGNRNDHVSYQQQPQPSTSVKDQQQHTPSSNAVGGDPWWYFHTTTFNVNILLIIGIVAGFVILIITLIVAVCKYNGTVNGRSASTANGGSRHNRRNGKGSSTTGAGIGAAAGAKCGYAYEACNTSPPPPGLDPSSASTVHHAHALNPPLVVNATTGVHPGLYGGVASPSLQTGYASMTSPSPYQSSVMQQQHQQLAGPPVPHTPLSGPGGCNEVAKPLAKKDVKEWYV